MKAADDVLKTFYVSQCLTENLINDLLDLAKMENNTFTFINEPFNLMDLIYETFLLSSHKATLNGIELVANTNRKADLALLKSVIGDRRRYLQILLNFLSNALKFTNSGGTVTVNARIVEQRLKISSGHLDMVLSQNLSQIGQLDSQQSLDSSMLQIDEDQCHKKFIKLRLTVEDTGCGISKEGQKNLFIDFNKLAENEQRN